MLDIPPLETERLVLRPWRPEKDAPAVFAYASLPEVTKYMIFDTHASVNDAHEYLERCKTSAEHSYGVTIKGNDTPIGGCGIAPVPQHSKGELGYVLHPNYWGNGYATEIVRRLIQYGFENLSLNKVFARADARNPASTRVMLKSGMSIEGTLRQDIIVRGVPISLVQCSILKDDWELIRGNESTPSKAPDVI
jgi:ribosomal-protein-alanine N-acetyltransferase